MEDRMLLFLWAPYGLVVFAYNVGSMFNKAHRIYSAVGEAVVLRR
jgi:hypothetical protein